MADLLALGGDWLRRQQKTHVSRQVSYARGATSVTVTVTLGRQMFRLSDGAGGTWVEWSDRDYLLLEPSELGALGEPARGDVITDATDGRRFEVLAPQGEPPWRWSDNRRTVMRVHSKDIGEA